MCIDEGLLQRNVEFHGPLCPGLAIGMQAAAIALRETGSHSQDEEAVAVVETDMCGADAIQVITGCTFGKGNLIHSDWGKNAYTFFRRSTARQSPSWVAPRLGIEIPLTAKISSGEATDADGERFRELHRFRARMVLETAPDALFAVEPVDGRELCPPCFDTVLASK